MSALDWDALTTFAAGPLVTVLCQRHPSLPWSDCEDAAAEALARAWAHRDQLDASRGNGCNWVATVAHRLLIDRERWRLHHPVLPLEPGAVYRPDPTPGPETAALAAWQAAAVAAVLAGLPPRQARVLWQHHALGVSLVALAARSGETVASMSMAAYHGRQTARRRWQEVAA